MDSSNDLPTNSVSMEYDLTRDSPTTDSTTSYSSEVESLSSSIFVSESITGLVSRTNPLDLSFRSNEMSDSSPSDDPRDNLYSTSRHLLNSDSMNSTALPVFDTNEETSNDKQIQPTSDGPVSSGQIGLTNIDTSTEMYVSESLTGGGKEFTPSGDNLGTSSEIRGEPSSLTTNRDNGSFVTSDRDTLSAILSELRLVSDINSLQTLQATFATGDAESLGSQHQNAITSTSDQNPSSSTSSVLVLKSTSTTEDTRFDTDVSPTSDKPHDTSEISYATEVSASKDTSSADSVETTPSQHGVGTTYDVVTRTSPPVEPTDVVSTASGSQVLTSSSETTSTQESPASNAGSTVSPPFAESDATGVVVTSDDQVSLEFPSFVYTSETTRVLQTSANPFDVPAKMSSRKECRKHATYHAG